MCIRVVLHDVNTWMDGAAAAAAATLTTQVAMNDVPFQKRNHSIVVCTLHAF